MKDVKFITYFDYLGFGDFIRNNDLDYQRKTMGRLYQQIESALVKGKLIEGKYGMVADLSKSRVHCINFSDTVIYWTNDASVESVLELLYITHMFNWQANLFYFPVRGCMTLGELERVEFDQKSGLGGSYNINSVFGKGLVKAHEIAESQNWAGTILDKTVRQFIEENLDNAGEILDSYIKSYKVPFKAEVGTDDVFHFIKGELNDLAFENYSNGIKDNFANHNKNTNHPSVQKKLTNTIDYLASYRNYKPE